MSVWGDTGYVISRLLGLPLEIYFVWYLILIGIINITFKNCWLLYTEWHKNRHKTDRIKMGHDYQF